MLPHDASHWFAHGSGSKLAKHILLRKGASGENLDKKTFGPRALYGHLIVAHQGVASHRLLGRISYISPSYRISVIVKRDLSSIQSKKMDIVRKPLG